MTIQIKICGIKTPEALDAAILAGARFIGFVFYPPSPRYIEIDTAKELAMSLPTGARAVGLFVDPSDEELDNILGYVPIDMIQLHGNESVERCKQIKEKYALPIIKAFPVSTASDIEKSKAYEDVANWLLFDNKTGGSGQKFDWGLLKGKEFSKPWMLSGGLDSNNIKEALKILSPNAVDISSGVERARGVKCPDKIRSFIEACN